MRINPKRILLIVLDSCGCGRAPDAEAFGDAGANTLAHTAKAVGGLSLPNLQRWGIGNIENIMGVAPAEKTIAAYGRMQERSAGKDTTVGHWEITGLITSEPFRVFPEGFPNELIDAFAKKTRRGVLGNKPASGTEIIKEQGEEQLRTGDWIVYTSGDSVFQIAAHEELISLEELYEACKIARTLCDPYRICRVIARPYVGLPGNFVRTYNRHDFGTPPPYATLLDYVKKVGLPVIGLGKISDIFCGNGITESIHTAGNTDGLEKTTERFANMSKGLMFVNLIDFDSQYGHRRNPDGFACALEEFDSFLPKLAQICGPEDLLFLTADHGNDPTHHGTDHTREQVPLLVYGPPTTANHDLGVRDSFADLAASIAEAFGIDWILPGKSFFKEIS
ncbi:MAG: phosphopentomutase [Pseudomonadota bacterium]